VKSVNRAGQFVYLELERQLDHSVFETGWLPRPILLAPLLSHVRICVLRLATGIGLGSLQVIRHSACALRERRPHHFLRRVGIAVDSRHRKAIRKTRERRSVCW
jgi:hypothetical protein